jgi:hypothetical protein
VSEPTVTTQTAATSGLAFPAKPASPLPDPSRSGPVPTRPLAVGELIDLAVALLRLHPGPTMGLATIVMAVQLLLLLPVQYATQDLTFSLLTPTPSSSGDPLTALLGIVVAGTVIGVITGLCSGVVAGMSAVVVGNAALRQPITVKAVWAQVRPRLWAIIGLSFLTGIAIAVGSSPMSFCPPVALGLEAAARAAFAAAIPALLLERIGLFGALKRGWSLVFTNIGAYLRTALTMLLALVAALIWQLVMALPFLAVAEVILSFDAPRSPSASQLLLSVIVNGLGTFAGSVVAAPFLGCVGGLLYVDRRMRAEGFDIDLGQRLRRREV